MQIDCKGLFTESESLSETKKVKEQANKINEQMANIKENFRLRVRFRLVCLQLKGLKA